MAYVLSKWQLQAIARLNQDITSKDNYWGAAPVWIVAVAALVVMVYIAVNCI